MSVGKERKDGIAAPAYMRSLAEAKRQLGPNQFDLENMKMNRQRRHGKHGAAKSPCRLPRQPLNIHSYPSFLEGKGREGLHSCTCLRGQLS
eukprot:1161948-Pelagomonas_calceolata.AAC.15